MIRKHPIFIRFFLKLLDIIFIIFSFYISFQLRFYLVENTNAGGISIFNFISVTPLILISYWISSIYLDRNRRDIIFTLYKIFLVEIKYLLKLVLLVSILLFSLLYIVKLQDVPRSWIIIFTLVNFVALSLSHYFQYVYIKALRRRGKKLRRVLIIGTGEKAQKYIAEVSGEDSWGINIVGFLSHDKDSIGRKIFNSGVIDCVDNLKKVLHNVQIDEVIFANTIDSMSKLQNLFEVCEEEGTPFKLISTLFNNSKSSINVTKINNIPVISFNRNNYSQEKLLIKRFIDIIISGLSLIFFSPIFAIICILIKITSRGPIFYVWKVVGDKKKNFVGYKFRTMTVNADQQKLELLKTNEMSGPVFKMKTDPRVTKFGAFLRKYSLDELPQLWSVFKGDMSLVGPRPPLQSEVSEYEHWHRRKLSFKPGITCLWQVNGRNEISDFNEWVKLDLEYIDNWSLCLDLKILLKTIPVILFGRGE